METKKETVTILEGLTSPERAALQGIAGGGQSREETADQETGRKSEARARRHPALRVLLWILRKSIVPILCVGCLLAGLYIGFTVVGKAPGDEVFQWETWKHMYDLVFQDK